MYYHSFSFHLFACYPCIETLFHNNYNFQCVSRVHAKTPDSKKEEFRRYLERSGAIDSLTSVLVGLYEEPDRPLESTEYIKRYLGGDKSSHSSGSASAAGGAGAGALAQQQQRQQEMDKLRRENDELKAKVHELNKTIETLRVNLKHARAEAKKARSG